MLCTFLGAVRRKCPSFNRRQIPIEGSSVQQRRQEAQGASLSVESEKAPVEIWTIELRESGLRFHSRVEIAISAIQVEGREGRLAKRVHKDAYLSIDLMA